MIVNVVNNVSIKFDILSQIGNMDNPIANLKNKEFSKLVLYCKNETLIFTCDEEQHGDNLYLLKKSIYAENICIEIHYQHMQWCVNGKLNILPLKEISRWVLEK
jgi:hypothetical protein